jgi:hypothetical protein
MIKLHAIRLTTCDEVYSGAHFTVIAATSSGLFTTQKDTKNRGQNDFFSERSRSKHIEMLYNDLLTSRWGTRGWTFQELILSKRAIIFVDNDIFWDCQHSIWDKDGLILDVAESAECSYTTPRNEMARQMSSRRWPDFSTYIEMVTLYNVRDLTYPQDALPAISGVLNTLNRGFASGFVGGLPRLFLDVALLWQPSGKTTRRIARSGGSTAITGHLPSWSWAGWNCMVDPFSLRSGLAYLYGETHQTRASTWRTYPLVQWYALSEDMQ